jgi:hypothetical protein
MSLVKANGAGEVSTGFYNNVATQSARFDANHYMTQSAPSSAGDRRQFTFSWWMKKSNAAEYATLYSNLLSSSNSNSTYFIIYIDGSASTIVAGGVDYAVVSSGKLRDITNWYHCVLVVDTDQASNDNRMKIYINGILGSSMSGTCPQTDLPVNNTQAYQIGRRMINNDRYMDAYIADFHLIDGTAVSDTSRTNPSTGATEYVIDEFGEFKNGVWIPKPYTGSFGTNGFRLEFKEIGTSANSSGIGADTSGNTHHFTPVNMVASDSNLSDSPENNFCTWNTLNKGANITTSEGNLKGVTNATVAQTIAGTFGVSSGKWYWEVRNEGGFLSYTGIVDATHDMTTYIGSSSTGSGYAYNSYAQKVGPTSGTASSYGASYTTGDIIGVALNMDDGEIAFYKANSAQGTAFTGLSGNQFPAVSGNGVAGKGGIANFGQDSSFAGNETAQNNTDGNGIGDFYYSPPSGYLALCSANLPDPTIGPQTSTQADDHFNTVLYTGNGSNSHGITGVGFQPDWVWIKERTNASSHYLIDSSRGLGTGDSFRALLTESTDAEYTALNDQLRTLDSDGFTLDDNTDTDFYVNRNSQTYVAWNWKANGGTATASGSESSNTLAYSAQANTTAGFSIVTYTGNGANNADVTVNHGLGVTPRMVIVKNRTDANRWQVYHEDLSADGSYTKKNILLNSGNAESGYSSQIKSVSSSAFVVRDVDSNGNANVNKDSSNYVAYVFAEIEGYSKFGSYVGNNSTDGTFVHLGFRPSFLMLKRSSDSGGWQILDNKRNTFNPVDNYLLPNLQNSEYDGSTLSPAINVDFVSNGFKLRTTEAVYNSSGGTFIYMAFADQPFRFSNAR